MGTRKSPFLLPDFPARKRYLYMATYGVASNLH